MGGKKGGGGRTPVEAPESGRSKQRVKIVEVISEGEIQGLVDGMKSIRFDNTPVQNADDSFNFNNVEVEGRIGSQVQDLMQGFQTVEKEVSVATEVTKRTALTRTVTDANVNSLRLTLGVQALFSQNEQGDTNPTTVELKITVGSQQIPFVISGKYSSAYSRSIEIRDLPRVPFTVKVERITADSTSNRLANKTTWASYTEIIDAQFSYPNTAYMGVKLDSEYFNNIPSRTYEVYGIKVKVPSNYNPDTRGYSGLWDGTFKVAYSDNPAWVLMDIVTNKRYGLGERLGSFDVDKWTLYQIARYCDQMIPDGYGGTEPRFTCNLWLTEQRSAYDVLSDLCSIFRAIPVWTGTTLTFIMDRPSDPVWTYTNANVINGEFTRQYSALKSRHNAIQVEYKDKDNNYDTAIEYVSDDALIRKHGLNLKKVTAFGCTSRGQAFRTGKWILETEKLETETITFTVGAEGLMNIPGDIIQVTDNHYAGANIGGRVVAVNGKTVTLDREIKIAGNSYLSFINAEAKHSRIKITSVNGNVVTLDSNPVGLSAQAVWSLATRDIVSRLYRCMTITEDADNGTYTIMALQHEPQKEAIVDNGASFEPRNTSLLNTPTLESVGAELSAGGLSLNWVATQGIGTLTYDIKILKDDNLYVYHKGLKTTEFSLEGLPDGGYVAVVIAKNSAGQVVSEKSQTFTISRPPLVNNVQVTGGLGNISLTWDWVDDFTETEIWVSEQDNLSTAKRLAKLTARMYTHEVGSKQVRYYWLRHVRGNNLGLFAQQGGIKGESSVDIDAELTLLNEKLSKNINIQAKQLTGKIAKNQLDSALVNELTQTQSTANAANSKAQQAQNLISAETANRAREIANEVANRTKAIKAESDALSAKIQSEANARGTAITQLQNTNNQQAQQIVGLTAKAESALSGLEAEKTARANGDKAEAKARETLTARIGGAESSISNIQLTKAGKNEVASLAQSALRSVWQSDAQSAVDKLQVGGRNLLRNSNINYTGNRYLTNFQLAQIPAVGEQLIVTLWGNLASDRQAFGVFNSHGYRELAQLRKIKEGVYKATFRWNNPLLETTEKDNSASTHLNIYAYPRSATSDNTISRVKLEIGSTGTDWTPAPEDIDSSVNAVSADLTSYKQTQATKEQAQASKVDGLSTRIGTAEGAISRVDSAVSNLNSSTTQQFNQVNANIGKVQGAITTEQNARATAIKSLSDRITTVNAVVGDAKAEIKTVSRAVADVDGKLSATHTIKTQVVGGGKTAIAGISLGANKEESSVIVMADRFQVVANAQSAPTPMLRVEKGKTVLVGDFIADGAITTAKLATNSVTANEIATGAVAAKHIAAKSINADHIASRSLTSDKLNVDSLSAINSNLGRVTAGTITGTAIEGNTITGGRIQGATIEGNTITGGTVQGTNINGSTIEGGIIRGARIEGLTIEAQNIIGDVVKIYSTRINYRGSNYDGTVTLTIQPHNKNRNFYLLPTPVLLENRGDFLSIRLNGGEWRSVRGQGYQFISGNFFLPAGQKMDIFIWASQAKADEFTFLSNNA